MPDVRFARTADLSVLESIENAADRRFVERFQPDTWEPAAPGPTRATQPGFILVASDPPIGFAHVLEVGGGAHLEQVAVLPEEGRRGIGAALVTAALEEAGFRGHHRLTLRTYADVPWNAPFYAGLGFVESEPDTPFLRGLVDVERRHGLTRYGRRIQMTASVAVPGPR